MKLWRSIIMILLLGFMVHCGGSSEGGSEAGNPTSSERSVIGSVESTTVSLNGLQALQATSGGCLVDSVLATDSLAQTISSTIDDSCAFSLSLVVGKAYMLSFLANDVFVAVLIVNDVSSEAIASSVFVVSAGDTEIDLGLITVSGSEAIPTNRPTRQNDRDGDGTLDDDDDDDDDDGQFDSEEEDCDLDGFIDDYDEDSECDENSDDDDTDEASPSGQILEVHPRNEEDHVGAEESIQVRFNCEIDTDTISATTFVVTDSSGNILACDFTFHEDGEEVECEHEDNFVNNDIYTAVLDGISCENGEAIEITTWSWDTEASTED